MEGLLHRMELAVLREALDRRHLAAVGLHREHGARLHGLAVDVHRAGAAGRGVAADVRAGQPESIAEELDEQQARLDVLLDAPAVHRQADGPSHASLLEFVGATTRIRASEPMLHTTGRASKVLWRRGATRLPGMRLRRLFVATALLALSPTSAWASGGVWSPVRVAPAIAKGSADLPRLALESDGTAVATWAEGGTVRAATRLPGKGFGAPRAIATSSTLAVPDAAVAVGTRGLVLLHAQQGSGATLVAASVTGASVGGPEQAAATTAPITEADGGAARRRQCARRLRRRADADDDLERGARRSRRLGAGRRRDVAADGHARPATAPLAAARRQRRPDVPRPGPGSGRRPRPYAAVRSVAGVWGALVSLDPGAVVACSDIGLAVDAAGNTYAAWSVSDGRVRTSLLPAGGGFSAALTTAVTARTPRLAAAPGGGVLLGWIDVATPTAPALKTAEWAPAGFAAPIATALPAAATTLDSLALADSTAASAIVTETTGTGATQTSGVDVLERSAASTPWTTQNVRTGLAEPVGSPQLAMGALGAIALWVEGNVIVASGTDHGLPRVLALAKPRKTGIGVFSPFRCARVTPGRRSRASRGATATAPASAEPPCGMRTCAPAAST